MSLYLGDNLISGVLSTVDKSERIGQIIQSTIPLTDAGLHLLDGALINGSGSYSAFVDYIAGLVSSYPDLFETEANWQTSVTTYGVCGKFVYDSVNNTVRLPKITGFTEGTITPTKLGDLTEAGLPNITGMWRDGEARAVGTSSGAFYGQSVAGRRGDFANATNVTENLNHVFDASRSSSIYGNSTTVQPQTIKVLYYIVIATSTKTDIEIDIDEVVTDLNGKADVDLTNCTKPHIVETYVNGSSWYRVYSDGWCEQGGELSASTTTVNYLKIFNNTNYTFVVSARVNGTNNEQTFHSIVMSKGASSITLKIGQYGTAATTSSNYTHCWQASGYIN